MKILHYIPDIPINAFPLGTPGRFTDFLTALKEDNHDNFVVISKNPVLQAALEREDISFFNAPTNYPKKLFLTRFVKKFLKDSSPDVVLRYDGTESRPLNILESLYNGPVRNIRGFYKPVVFPDPAVKKLSRADSHTPEASFVIGSFVPGFESLTDITKLFECIKHDDDMMIWIAAPAVYAEEFEKIAALENLGQRLRIFDVTTPRAAFYKAVDLVFIPDTDTEADIMLAEACSLGKAVISFKNEHEALMNKQMPCVIKDKEQNELARRLKTFRKEDSFRIKCGEDSRAIYTNLLHPSKTLPEILEYL